MTTLIPKFQQTGTGAVNRPFNQKLAEQISVKDFGAVGDGVTDDTAAINATMAYAFSIYQTTISTFAPIRFGGTTVYMPEGTYITSATINLPTGVSLVGAGNFSTIISSSYDGYIIRNEGAAGTYTNNGSGIKDIVIIGDRTKTNQVGVGLLRDNQGYYSNVVVFKTGSHGFVLKQCLQTYLDNIEVVQCVGIGLKIDLGQISWADPTSNGFPSNAVCCMNSHFFQNDAEGIYLTGEVSGSVFYSCVAEYNYNSSPPNTGYNIRLDCNTLTPNQFTNAWCEGPCKSHIYVDTGSGSQANRFTNLNHYSDGSTGNVDRAIIVNTGTLIVENAYGQGAPYKLINGSIAPFRVTKATGLIRVNNVAGNTISDNRFVEDETGATTGLLANVRMDNFGATYVLGSTSGTFGQISQQYLNETQSFPFLQIVPGFGLMIGNGTAAPTAQILSSTGSPNGAITASPGSLYLNTSGGAGTTLYIKESGVGTATGWVAK